MKEASVMAVDNEGLSVSVDEEQTLHRLENVQIVFVNSG